MKKYRVEFVRYQVMSVTETEQEIPTNDTFLEEHTGDTIWAILHAEDDQKARQKAEQLAHSLATGDRPNHNNTA
ncbi:hypothetical protein EXU57_03305 [Segetibacter sp. 3557_3]|uniref:hypothetical protein n=1 Tax=Segetibacter sp. 3557_3 TaxID=2547429 RepID=UPI0010586DD6|nr:hypothetical protein [Segetibacter sp. 3557_3]TDH29107.1 hypothetical protein EXU57_03305 [Segetibacter sp. 3557_3]